MNLNQIKIVFILLILITSCINENTNLDINSNKIIIDSFNKDKKLNTDTMLFENSKIDDYYYYKTKQLKDSSWRIYKICLDTNKNSEYLYDGKISILKIIGKKIIELNHERYVIIKILFDGSAIDDEQFIYWNTELGILQYNSISWAKSFITCRPINNLKNTILYSQLNLVIMNDSKFYYELGFPKPIEPCNYKAPNVENN